MNSDLHDRQLAHPESSSSSKLKILIVDDEEDIRAEISEYLERKGYNASCAMDGLDALESFEREQVHAIITDVKMPRCDGHAFITKIRESDLDVPIIALTGHYSPDELAKLKRAGASLTVKKPARLSEILRSLQWLLAPE